MRRLMVILMVVFPMSLWASAEDTKVRWQAWSDKAFEQAGVEGKLVLLEMEAVWCHWCHVMDKETYSRADVAEAIHRNFVPLRVDHDARPDLANRYRDWGWPATIILKPDGTELVKRAGYIAAEPFLRLLAAVVADPTPERNAAIGNQPTAALSSLTSRLRSLLLERHIQSTDMELGGLKTPQKFIEPGALYFALQRAASTGLDLASRMQARRIARKTLDGALNLIDPVWGGVYQYSTGGNWQTPHYEKLMFVQARYLKAYAMGAALFKDERYSRAAEKIVTYIETFMLADSGAFYTSQDADLIPGKKSKAYFALGDEARRRQGIPRIDRHIYARENGLAIEALLRWYEYGANKKGLTLALTATQAISKTHLRGRGGWAHAAAESSAGYLEDSLAMAQAQLALYEVTAERMWLRCAIEAAEFIEETFSHSVAGWLDTPNLGPLKPHPNIDQNVDVGRFFNRLHHFTGNSRWRKAAEHAMRFLSAEAVALSRLEDSGILLFDDELNSPPLHYAVVAKKSDPLAQQQFAAALSDPIEYKRVEWWDRSEGPLLNDDVPYPNFPQAAAYVCSQNRCSAPAFDMASWQLRRQSLLALP